MSDVCPGACSWAPGSPGRLHVAQGPHVPGCHRAVTLPMGPHQTSRRGPSSRPRERAGKQEGWDGVGALLCPLSSLLWLSLRLDPQDLLVLQLSSAYGVPDTNKE